MSDSGDKGPFEGSSKRTLEDDEGQEAVTKRPRGPYDCLDWSDSDDEPFTPFTQSNPPPSPPKVFAVKSKAKKVVSKKSSKEKGFSKKSSKDKGVGKKSVAKNFSSTKDGSVVSKSKGKSLGKYVFFSCCNFNVFTIILLNLLFDILYFGSD